MARRYELLMLCMQGVILTVMSILMFLEGQTDLGLILGGLATVATILYFNNTQKKIHRRN